MNKKIKIKNGNSSYFVNIEYNSFKINLLKLIKKEKIFIVIDKKVDYLLKKIILPNNVFVIKIESSEKIKSISSYHSLTKKVLSKGIDRNSVIIAIGGGTIGDLSGFVASTILRGVKFILMPTTLLSQVDSSIGGKNGINTSMGKNLIGTFYNPDAVYIDPKILSSLSKREIKSGYAEIIKHSLINDLSFFNWLDQNHKKIFSLEKNAIVYSIYKSVKIKSKYVVQDNKEKLINKNSRAILNFGHTFGHAIETFYNYKTKITHGEAISIGMIFASKLSKNLGYISIDELDKIINHFKRTGLPIRDNNINYKKILTILKKDKKNNNDKINLILLKKIGRAYFARNVNPKNIIEILN